MLWIHYGGYVFTQVYLFVCLFVCQQDDTETTKLDFNRTWMLAKNRPHLLFVHFSLNNAWNLMKKRKIRYV